MSFELRDLTDKQKKAMKVRHYMLHLPPTMTQEQYKYIAGIARSVINNEPFTFVHEKAMQFLLRMAYHYRNVLTEFDEQDRWSDEDESTLNKISLEFKPILEYLVEEFKLDVSKFRRD